MRIATGGFYHEINSFGNLLVTPEFLTAGSCEGQDWYLRYRGVKRYNGGFIDEAEALGIECVPALMSNILPPIFTDAGLGNGTLPQVPMEAK